MNCRLVERQLEAWLAGMLGGRRHRAVSHHLARCQDCRARARRLERLEEMLRRWSSSPEQGITVDLNGVLPEEEVGLGRTITLPLSLALALLLLLSTSLTGNLLLVLEPGSVASDVTSTPGAPLAPAQPGWELGELELAARSVDLPMRPDPAEEEPIFW